MQNITYENINFTCAELVFQHQIFIYSNLEKRTLLKTDFRNVYEFNLYKTKLKIQIINRNLERGLGALEGHGLITTVLIKLHPLPYFHSSHASHRMHIFPLCETMCKLPTV